MIAWFRCALAASFIALFSHVALAQQGSQIGVAAAVNPDAQGTPPSAETRTLEVGVNVQANERIVTSANGQAQMLFLDESAFTVGPNSDLVLDEFVFDPSTGTGRIALTAAKGVFRMVGGKISKRTPVTLKTPTAVIGIRGGIALVNVADNGATQATFLFGDQMTVDTGGGQQAVNRPGFTVTAESADAPPSPPAPATTEQLTGALGSLEGSAPPPDDGGGDGDAAGGGGGNRPTDQQVAASNLGALGSGNDPNAVGPAGPEPGGPAPAPTGGGGSETAESTTTQSQQTNKLQDSDTLGVSFSGFSGRYRTDEQYLSNTLDSNTFEIDPDTARNIGFKDSSAAGGTFTADLGSSTLSLPIQTGTFSINDVGTTPFGTVSGTGFLSSDQRFFFYEVTEDDDSNTFIFGGKALTSTENGFEVKAFSLRKDFLNDLSTDIPLLKSAPSGVTVSTSTSSPYYAVRQPDANSSSATLQATLGIVGQGSSQKSVFVGHTGVIITNSQSQPAITGGFRGTQRASATSFLIRNSGGLSSVPGSDGVSLFSDSNGDLAYFVINNDAYATGQNTLTTQLSAESPFNASTDSYSFDHVALPTTNPSGIGNTRTSRTMKGYVGGLVERDTSSSFPSFIIENDGSTTGSPGDPIEVAITTNASNNRISGEFDFQVEDDTRNYEFFFGTTNGNSGRGTFIDDNNFGARDSSSVTSNIDGTAVNRLRMFMVNQEVVSTTGFLPSGVSFCDCQYLEWGYWLAEGRDASSNVDRIHLATWVAGDLTDIVDLPSTGSATYNGHLNGSVDNNVAVTRPSAHSRTCGTSAPRLDRFRSPTSTVRTSAASRRRRRTGANSLQPAATRPRAFRSTARSTRVAATRSRSRAASSTSSGRTTRRAGRLPPSAPSVLAPASSAGLASSALVRNRMCKA